MPVQVQIIYPDGPMDIQEDATVIVPAGDLAVVVTGAPDAPIRFDGRIQPFFPTGPDSKMAPLKLARSTGFHHLSIPPGHDFWLGTEDAKLQLDGIEEMLLYLPSEGLDWSGQFLFSDGSYYRDPHVTYGWLDQHADHLLTAAELIVVRPQRSEAPTTRMTARGGKRLDLQATASLLRRRGATLLDQTVNGPVVVDGRGYTPRCVIARMHHEALDNAANRKVVWLVAQIETLIAEVHKEVRRERKV